MSDVEIKDNFYTGFGEVDTGIYREGNMEESFMEHYENTQRSSQDLGNNNGLDFQM